MNKPRKIRDAVKELLVDAAGEEWEWDTPTIDWVPGTGFGATAEATPWAAIGYHVEQVIKLRNSFKRRAGRPARNELDTKDAWRAYTLWQIAQRYPLEKRRKITTRHLVKICSVAEMC